MKKSKNVMNLKNVIIFGLSLVTTLSEARSLNQFFEVNINQPSRIFTPAIVSPLRLNTLEINGSVITLPTSLQVELSSEGKYKLKNIDILLHHKVGNGGDYIRSNFIRMGEAILKFLETTPEGSSILSQTQLNLNQLKATLDINNLVATDETLIDNTGSVVDAIGLPGLIILNNESWLNHFEKNRDIYFLVFHEMLRSAEINDDNYVFSKSLNPFPESLKVTTQLLPIVPLVDEDSIENLISLGQINLNGKGCLAQNTYTDLDFITNTLEISMKSNIAINSSQSLLDRLACTMSIPVSIPSGKKLVISLIDLQGEISANLGKTQPTSESTLRFEAFLAGSTAPAQIKKLKLVDTNRSFLFRRTDVLSSGCGAQVILRINTSNLLKSEAPLQPLDVTAVQSRATSQIKKIKIYFNLESCN